MYFLVLIINLIILILLSGTVHPNPGPSEFYMSVAHLNARSLNISDKLSEISAIAFLHKFDLFAFSETWLNSKTLDDSILILGYNAPLRKDRIISRGGGVALGRLSFAFPGTANGRFEFSLPNFC